MLLPNRKGVYFHRILVHNVYGSNQVPAFGASIMFDFGHLFSQVSCSLVGKVKGLGDRIVWCNSSHNKIQQK